MPQYRSRVSAMGALGRYFFTGAVTDIYKERLMLGALCELVQERREAAENSTSQKFSYSRERAYRHLKSIAKCIGHWPISEEMIKAHLVSKRIGGEVGILVEVTRKYDLHGRPRKSGNWEIIVAAKPISGEYK